MDNVSFKISSALKNIIGKELITDDFIAVFELVKNSYDANASQVEIIFKDLKSDKPMIIIKDDGIGMDESDIKDKWLFVAYSEKKDNSDYRNLIKSTRAFAGAKGIGRFSCDRLGEKLLLVSKKKKNPKYCHLEVDWKDFEMDAHAEFQTISATMNISKESDYSFSQGTVLEISKLRNIDWDRAKLLKLRQSLERLINPNQSNENDNFKIILSVPEEESEDKRLINSNEDEPWKIVNGEIKNFIFEELDLKTTQIQLEIDKEGKTLKTTLTERGTLIYELIETNPYKDILHSISINLFFLNRSAKYSFSRRMGLSLRKYGSVFLYKNGFRIHPFGNPDNDSLGIDRRKQQGHFRFLGSRDISGRIEINGNNPSFQETSSRDGGLIKNHSYEVLNELFIEYALKRLENFTINFAKFGVGGEYPDIVDPNSSEQRKIALDIISKLTQSKDVVNIKYNKDVLDILENYSSNSVTSFLKNLHRIATESENYNLLNEIKETENQVDFLRKAKEEAEEETLVERKRAQSAEVEAKEAIELAHIAEEKVALIKEQSTQKEKLLKDVSSQNLFLKSVLSKDLQHVIDLHHTISVNALSIEQFVSYLLILVKSENKHLDRAELKDVLEKISFTTNRILTISRFATHANFRADAEEITNDLIGYIREYLLNVYGGSVKDPYHNEIPIHFYSQENINFFTTFSPLNISIIFDNLISNSRKHKSTEIEVKANKISQNKLEIRFKDDGTGIPKQYQEKVFDIGFSTTDGSGLGLNHIEEIIKSINGTIELNTKIQSGAEFVITFLK
jgi:signal transduction histidine kinase